jgi:SAM-dependent methyltransferase
VPTPADTDSGSIRFDRAAEFYDRTRALSPEAERATVELLRSELTERGRCLEVGVGTGLISLPLHRAGMRMVGLDLSHPMLAKLVEKAAGRIPFPLVLGNATRMPFRDRAFAAGLFRHVLHLIPGWREAVTEIVRLVRPGGVVLANLGSFGGPWEEMQRRFAEESGVRLDPVGLDWNDWESLDSTFAAHGARWRRLPAIVESSNEPLAEFIGGMEQNVYSWTWPVPQERRIRAAAAVRTWAAERFGPLDRPYPYHSELLWRAYDVP